MDPSGSEDTKVTTASGSAKQPLLVRVGGGVLALVVTIGSVWAGVTAVGDGVGLWRRLTHDAPRSPAPALLARTPELGLEFAQEGSERDLREEKLTPGRVRVSMRRGPFEIRFPVLAKDVALEICAWTDDSVFSAIHDGKPVEDTPFGPGRGMADTHSGSSTLMLDNEAMNYLVGERIIPVSEYFSRVYFGQTLGGPSDLEKPLAQQKDDLYLTVVVDKNKNKVFDLGEYEFIVLDF
jgi:hypothetical protein